jgi:hypothetical protein
MENEKVLSDVVHPEFQDTEVVCIVCGSVFTFEKGEAEFFYSKGYLPPKRCPMCRKWKRVNRDKGVK